MAILMFNFIKQIWLLAVLYLGLTESLYSDLAKPSCWLSVMTSKWLSCQGVPLKEHLHAANQQKMALKMLQGVSKMPKWATEMPKLAAYCTIFVAKVGFKEQKIIFKIFSANIKTVNVFTKLTPGRR